MKYNISLNLALTSNGKFASKNFSKNNTFEFHIKIEQFFQTRLIGILNLITSRDELFSAEEIAINDNGQSLSETIEVTRPGEDTHFKIFLEHKQEYQKNKQPLSTLPAGIVDCLQKFDRDNIHNYYIRIISSVYSLDVVAHIFDSLSNHFSKRLFKCDRILLEKHGEHDTNTKTTLSRIFVKPRVYMNIVE